MLAHIEGKEPEISLIRGYRSSGEPLPEFNQLLYRYGLSLSLSLYERAVWARVKGKRALRN